MKATLRERPGGFSVAASRSSGRGFTGRGRGRVGGRAAEAEEAQVVEAQEAEAATEAKEQR